MPVEHLVCSKILTFPLKSLSIVITERLLLFRLIVGGWVLPAVGQVESDAAADVLSEADVPDGPQADVEEGHDAHPQIQNLRELLRPLHFVLQGENLHENKHAACTGFVTKGASEETNIYKSDLYQ